MEDENNLDDLIDYKDFESNIDSNYDQDSFNNNIMKIYADHKKINTKALEIQNTNRPISSYQRNMSAGKREEKGEEDVNPENIFERLDNHIIKNKIKKNDFIDNQNIFLDINEFKDLFRRIKFDISNNELQSLFSFNNGTENYILGKTFLNNFKLNWFEDAEHKVDLNNFKINDINNEFKNLKEEVLNIIEKEFRAKSSSKPIKKPQSSKVTNIKSRPITTIIEKNEGEKKEKKHKSFLVNTMKKKKAEEELIRLEIEKRNREFEIDTINKMDEANKICDVLNIQQMYTAYKNEDENDNNLICRVFNKTTKQHEDIDLKKFITEFKKLKKLHNLNEKKKYYIKTEEVKKSQIENSEFMDLNRGKRQEAILNILKDSLKQKIELKKQLKSIRDKKIVDESILRNNLRFTNLDDNQIV